MMWQIRWVYREEQKELAGTTGLEPATSDVTGRRSNQLSYVPAFLSEHFHCTTHYVVVRQYLVSNMEVLS